MFRQRDGRPVFHFRYNRNSDDWRLEYARRERHDQAKPLHGFGSADVLEVVEDWRGDTYRGVYTVRYAARVFVLHVFQKKSKKGIATPKPDTDLIKVRLKAAAARAKELENG